MRNEVGLFLAFMREGNKRNIPIPPVVFEAMIVAYAITPQERREVGEVLKADVREQTVSYPGYEYIKEMLDRLK